MNRMIKSTWSRLSEALPLCLRREQAPSIDSVLNSVLLVGRPITPAHLGFIHDTTPRSVLRVLKAAAKLKEPLIRPVGPRTSEPLQQRYLLTEAGRQKAGRNCRIEMARRERVCQASPPGSFTNYTFRRLPARDDTILDLEDPPRHCPASTPKERLARLRRFLKGR